jgi:hypothetical protein
MPSVDECSSAMLTVCPSDGIKGIISLSRLPTEGEEEYEGEYYNASLLDTMQIVAPDPVKERPSVPNHILNTKLYKKIKKNDLISINPSVIHFTGFEPQCKYWQKFELVNMSSDIQRFHVIPPQSKYFKVSYTKNARMVPGLVTPFIVKFFPDDWRYYYDCVRIHCKNDNNMIIPIHAYPVLNTSEFPKTIDFSSVPVGETKSKVFPLRCQAPINFEFSITYIQPHPAYKVTPLSGIVPASGEVDISVSFTPTQFCTAIMKFQLEISQFLSKPHLCTVTGLSQPGLTRDKQLKMADSLPTPNPDGPCQTLDPSTISPLDRSRSKRIKKKCLPISSSCKEVEIECDGLKIPANLDSPYSVALVLNQQRGKRRMKDLLQQSVNAKDTSTKTTTRQMKETAFECAIRQNVYEERQNQLKWQVKLGEEPVSQKFCSDVFFQRQQACHMYNTLMGVTEEEDEVRRGRSELFYRKTRRDVCS